MILNLYLSLINQIIIITVYYGNDGQMVMFQW